MVAVKYNNKIICFRNLIIESSTKNLIKLSNYLLILFLGVFQECETFDDYNKNLVENVILLYECDTFNLFVDILLFEVK